MAAYTLLTFVRPAIYIVLLPLYLAEFSESEYGIYNLMIDFGQFMMIVVTLRISAAMLNQYYDYIDDKKKQRKYLSSLYSFSILISAFFILLLYFFGEGLFNAVFKSDSILFFPYGFTIIAYAILSEINLCYFTFLKNEKDIVKYFFVILLQVGLVMFFQFLYIIVLQKGVGGALIGMLMANVITTLAVLLMERNIITFSPDMAMIKKSLKFSVVLIPYLMIYWLMFKGGRLFLERYTDLNLVGIYALIIVLTGVVVLAIDAVQSGIRPFLFELFADKKGDKKQISLLTKMMVNVPLLIIPVVILVGCNMQVLTSNTSWYSINIFMSMASVVVYVLVFSKLFYLQLVFARRSDLITLFSFLTVLILLVGFTYLIPLYKIWGVLWATLIANVCMAILFYFAAQKVNRIAFDYKSIFLNPLLVFFTLFAIEKLVISRGWSYGSFGLLQFLIIVGLIILLNVGSIKDYKTIFVNAKQKLPSKG